MTIAGGVGEQTEQCLRNISAVLADAGATMADVVRVWYILPRAEDFPQCYPALRRCFADVRPAATMIEAGLIDHRILIEIEVTARRRARWAVVALGRYTGRLEVASARAVDWAS